MSNINLDATASDQKQEQQTDYLRNSEQAAISNITKDFSSFIARSALLHTEANQSENINFIDLLTQSLSESDPELAGELREVLNDAEVAAYLAAFQRLGTSDVTQADIELIQSVNDHPEFRGVKPLDSDNPDSTRGELDAATQERLDVIDAAVEQSFETPDNPRTATNILSTLGSNSAGSFGFLATANGLFDNAHSHYFGRSHISGFVSSPGLGAVNTAGAFTASSTGLVYAGLNLQRGITAAQEGDSLNAGLDITVGILGLTRGLQGLTKLVGTKIAQRVGSEAATRFFSPGSSAFTSSAVVHGGVGASSKLAQAGAAFAIGVGSALAVAAGVASITRNAIAADKARENGQVGVAAIYGTQAALDGVGTVLNVASLVADFVPGPGTLISLALDAVNLALTVINIGLGFVVDLVVDDAQLQRDAFEQYLNSSAFKNYVDEAADNFANSGYDTLELIIDSENAGVDDFGTGKVLERRINRNLSEQADLLPDSDQLRVAILDQSTSGHVLTGRNNDDFLSGGEGDDQLIGLGGNDILNGGAGNDTLEGGTGDDKLTGGRGSDISLGGPGDDTIELEVGIDEPADGGDGHDTAELTVADTFAIAARAGATIKTDLNTQTSTLELDRNQLQANIQENGVYSLLYPERNLNLLHKTSDPRVITGEKLNEIFKFTSDYTEGNQVTEQSLKDQDYIFLGSHNEWTLFYNIQDDILAGVARRDTTNTIFASFERASAGDDIAREFADSTGSTTTIETAFQALYLIGLAQGAIAAPLETSFSNIESTIGSQFADNIVGDEGDNYLDGGEQFREIGSQKNILKGNGGNDVLVQRYITDDLDGGEGTDTLVTHVTGQGHRVYDLEAGKTYLKEGAAGGLYSQNINNFERFLGSEDTETVYGSQEANYLNGGAGNDILDGRGGNDYLVAGEGNDQLSGGAGNDVLVSGKGNNELDGGDGNDTAAFEGEAPVTADLQTGQRTIKTGEAGSETTVVVDTLKDIENLRGGAGQDILSGDNSNNILNGGGIVDELHGRGGDDTFVVNVQNDNDNALLESGQAGLIDGGQGADTLDYSGLGYLSHTESIERFVINLNTEETSFVNSETGTTQHLHNLSGIENAIAVDGAKTRIVGNSDDNVITANNTHTVAVGREGNDTYVAGTGAFSFNGGEGTDTLTFERISTDSLNGQPLTVTLAQPGETRGTAFAGDVITNGHSSEDTNVISVENVTGHAGDDRITGSSDNNVLNGLDGYDILNGKGGDDTLIAKRGILKGGKGQDTYIIADDARDLQIQDNNTEEGDGGSHLVFQNIRPADLSVSIVEVNRPQEPAHLLRFHTQKDGETVTLADWQLRDQDLDLFNWQPLFEALGQTVARISFTNDEGQTISTLTGDDLGQFFYRQFVETDSHLNVDDFRGRHIKYNAENFLSGSFSGTHGDDYLDCKDVTGNLTLHALSGSDVLVGGSGKNDFTVFHQAGASVVDATQGSGRIDLQNTNSVVLLSSASGDYTIKDGNGAEAANGVLVLNDIGLESIDFIYAARNGNVAVRLQTGSTISLIKNQGNDSLPVERIQLSHGDTLTVAQFIEQFEAYKKDLEVSEGDNASNVIPVDYLGVEADAHGGNDTFVITRERTLRNDGRKALLNGGEGIDKVDYSQVDAASVNILLNNHYDVSQGASASYSSIDGAEEHALINIEQVVGAKDAENTIRYQSRDDLIASHANGFDVTHLSEQDLQYLRNRYGVEYSSPDLSATGGNKDDVITLAEGNDTLDGLAGNDTLNGGTGSDTYRFGRDYGRDTITDTGGGNDVLNISDLSLSELLFQQKGDDLVITQLERDSSETLANSSHRVTIENQFGSDTSRKVERVTVEGTTLNQADLNALVRATTTFLAGSETDDGDSLIIGEGYNQLSTLNSKVLAGENIGTYRLIRDTDGQPLSESALAQLTKSLDKDFSNVKVSTDNRYSYGNADYNDLSIITPDSDYLVTGTQDRDFVWVKPTPEQAFSYSVNGGAGDDLYLFEGRSAGVHTILDSQGKDALSVDNLLDSAVFRRVDNNLEIIKLDRSSQSTLDSSRDKVVVVNHFAEGGDYAVETIGDLHQQLSVSDINKLVVATATFLASSGADDDGGSLVIGENFDQLSKISVSTLA